MSSVVPVTSPDMQPLSEVERVVDTFVAPTKTFTDLRRSANWLIPWLLLAISSVAMVWVVDVKVGMQRTFENQLATQPKRQAQVDQLPPDKRAAQMHSAVVVTRVFAYGSPITILIFLAIVAGILLATFNFGFGTELTFNQCLAVCMYASLPGVIKALIAILSIMLGGGEGFTFQNPVASNLSALVDPSAHFLYSIATSVDIFTIWTLILTGIAFACLTKLKRGSCLAVVFGWWALEALVQAGFAAAFS